jgi:type II secretory pathway pseudopilin PulG
MTGILKDLMSLASKRFSKKNGFTLVELLVIIGILTILLSIIVIAVNPSRKFKQANNTQRLSDINVIINAVHEWAMGNSVDMSKMHGGAGLPTTATNIGANDVDICGDLVPTYIPEMPYDPTDTSAHYKDCSDYDTGYTIVSTTGPTYTITVAAPNSNFSTTIEVSR